MTTAIEKKKKTFKGISSFTLHILAMIFMLSDHLWATVIPGQQWMTGVGRLAFPIFAFMCAEGYFHTKDFGKYIKRMLLFALLSEIPYNLLVATSFIFPFQQNVLWTFIFALMCMRGLDRLREKEKPVKALILGALLIIACYLGAKLTMTDYFGYGVLTVLVFYFFRGDSHLCRLCQLVAMIGINVFMMSGLMLPMEIFGYSFEFPLQGFAFLSVFIIWLYRGRQGPHNKIIKYINYSFYPLHMLILGLIVYLK